MAHVVVPDLGDGIEKVEIVLWHKKSGERVGADEDLLELVTDKASFNVAAPQAGILTKTYFKEGQEAKIGDILADIE